MTLFDSTHHKDFRPSGALPLRLSALKMTNFSQFDLAQIDLRQLIVGHHVDQAALTGLVLAPAEHDETHDSEDGRQAEQDGEQLPIAQM
jgi:hypothetical protein